MPRKRPKSINVPAISTSQVKPYGEESWKALEAKIMGKQVRLDIIDIDQYKRMVGVIWIGNRNINLEMVKEGYAEEYLDFSFTAVCGFVIVTPYNV
ncbi:MAG: thermonuclease family protein [Proteobacteria bacterium]|nr:thermonuclease family protein [Pseudomonadota bacterium]